MSKITPKKRIKKGSKPALSFLPYTEDDLNVVYKKEKHTFSPNLFRSVSASTFSHLATFLLCVSFFLQGFNYVEAETETEEIIDIDESVFIDEPITETETFESAEAVVEAEVVSDETLSEEAVPEEQELAEFSSPDTPINLEGETMTDTEDELVTEDLPSNPDTVDSEITSSDQLTETEEEDTLSDEDVLVGTEESISVVQSDTAYTFNRNECTKLATGSFYCLKPVEDMLEDALFAAPDADGDLEIFLVRGGLQSQITSNQVDDAAPYFDENSNTIVWHRLLNDRFQIVSYEISTGVETILTNTSQNNMEPTRQGSYTVWQRWVDGSWNIILHDGSSETKLTNGIGHNVAPYIHGSLVVWNRHNGDGNKTIEMYDINTRSYVSVPDAEGLSVSNPRMVFVFDSLTPEGDIVTKGYDMLSKKFIDLSSLPRNLPDEIPKSDSTGETRALIQSKPTLKTDVEEMLESDLVVPTGEPEPALDSLTLNLATTTISEVPTPVVETDGVEFELVIEPYNATTTSSSSEQIIE